MERPAPRIAPTGFREYDLRWRYPEEIDLAGMEAVGLAVAHQLAERAGGGRIVVGHDFRAYSAEVAEALISGLVAGGAEVIELGMVLSPMAYFAPGALGADAFAMVTASHNPNGWTGVKLGMEPPLPHRPAETARLAEIVRRGLARARPGGARRRVAGFAERYLDHLARGVRLARPLHVLCATGNGTAGAFAPAFLERLGVRVTGRLTALDAAFPNYDPDPEAPAMQADMGRAVRAAGAELGLGFDGDGDRCGVVDGAGRAIHADRLALLIARRLARRQPRARFLADVKSTGLLAADPALAAAGAAVEYWKTGHSHLKHRMRERGALAAFERSAHYYFAPPVGDGFDCGLRAALEVLRLVAEAETPLGALVDALPPSFASPTLSLPCPDEEKYGIVERVAARLGALAAAGGRLGPRAIRELVTVNGVRAELAGGGFALVRASSNTPALVVVCESLASAAEMEETLAALGALIRTEAPGLVPPGWPG